MLIAGLNWSPTGHSNYFGYIPVILQAARALLAFRQPNHIAVYAHRRAELGAYRALELFRVYVRDDKQNLIFLE